MMRPPGTVPEELQLELWPDMVPARRTPLQGVSAGALEPAAPSGGPDNSAAIEAAIQRVRPGSLVQVQYTANKTVILSLSTGRDGIPVLRAHECFRTAPRSVANAAVRLYLGTIRRSERRRLSHLVTSWHHATAAPPDAPDRTLLDTGRHHDLRACLDRINGEWFEGALDMDITFGRHAARHTMGRHERRRPRSLVIINPILDHPWITTWYLDYLVFHEGLHEVILPRSCGGRMAIHPPEFRERERLHPDFSKARIYEEWITGTAWRELHRAWSRSRLPKTGAAPVRLEADS